MSIFLIYKADNFCLYSVVVRITLVTFNISYLTSKVLNNHLVNTELITWKVRLVFLDMLEFIILPYFVIDLKEHTS